MSQAFNIAIADSPVNHPALAVIPCRNTDRSWAMFAGLIHGSASYGRPRSIHGKGGTLWAPCHFRSKSMRKEDLTDPFCEASMIVLDLDRITWGEVSNFGRWLEAEKLAALTHTTWSATANDPHLRIILPLAVPMRFTEAVKRRNEIARRFFKFFDFTAWRYYLPRPGAIVRESKGTFLGSQ